MNFPRAITPFVVVTLMSFSLLVSLTACAAPATHHLRIVNATFDGMTGLAFAPSGSTDFEEVAMMQPLAGGLASVTVDVPPGTCRRDVRITFKNARTLLYPDMDVCRSDGLRLAVGSGRLGRATPLKEEDLQATGSP
jgi:hypothetical protein